MTDRQWPSYESQQKICKRGDTVVCAAAGAPGCALCMPERYTDAQIAALGLPVAAVRENQRKRAETQNSSAS